MGINKNELTHAGLASGMQQNDRTVRPMVARKGASGPEAWQSAPRMFVPRSKTKRTEYGFALW
jgi:hypothetical protein